MDIEDFNKLSSLSESPELFEKKRQHLLNDFINSVASKKEREKLRLIQKELDLERDQPESDPQIAFAQKILQHVSLKSRLLKDVVNAHSDKKPDSPLISFPYRR